VAKEEGLLGALWVWLCVCPLCVAHCVWPTYLHSPLRCVISDERYVYSVMPYCSQGELFDHVSDNGRFTEGRARYWFKQILNGTHHLQQKGVVHRDMSLENLMVHDGRTIVIDMGMCLRIPYLHASGTVTDCANGQHRLLITKQSRCGKPNYMSPEVVESRGPFDGFSVDMWANGVILFIMLTGVPPFDTASPTDGRFNMVGQGKLANMLEQWQMSVSPEAGDLMQNMLWPDPSRRLSLEQVAVHPWVTNPDLDPP